MDDRAHFGLGRARRVDSLEIEWPDGRYQLLTNLSPDRLVLVRQSDAKERKPAGNLGDGAPLREQFFQPLDSKGLKYAQHLSTQVDYAVQPLLPYELSKHGPPLAVADVNGDGLDDVFIGGGAGVAGKLFMQQKDGSFVESVAGQPWQADKDYEDWGAVFFDANGDGRPDLYVASGGYELVRPRCESAAGHAHQQVGGARR
jgi:hypothetical protein